MSIKEQVEAACSQIERCEEQICALKSQIKQLQSDCLHLKVDAESSYDGHSTQTWYECVDCKYRSRRLNEGSVICGRYNY